MAQLDTPTREYIEDCLATCPTPKIFVTNTPGAKPLESPPVKINGAPKITISETYFDRAKLKNQEQTVQGVLNKTHKLLIKKQNWDLLKQDYCTRSIEAMQYLQLLQDEDSVGCSTADLYGFWITITPDHETKDPIHLLQRCAEKICRKKGISKFIYTFEQTGDSQETMGYHPHVHILVERSITNQGGEPNKLKKGIDQTIKSFFKDKHNTLIKPQKKGKEHVRIQYCQGFKSDKMKENALQIDKLWRSKNSLKDYYTNF